jgi:MFS family permease
VSDEGAGRETGSHGPGPPTGPSGLRRWLRAPETDTHERRLLGMLGAASFFSHYDLGLFSLLLVQIQSDLGIPESQLGLLGSIVRLGALPAFAVLLMADRWGRRPVLLFTILGYTVCTAASACAPGYASLVAFQSVSRAFIAAEFLLAMVVVVEEFRPTNRGWGIALLGTLAILGHGAAFLLFGAVEHLPYGWRALYAAGVVPLLLIARWRRGLPETRRFERVAQGAAGGEVEVGGYGPGPSVATPDSAWRTWLAPLRTLVRDHPRRCAAVGSVSFLWAFSNTPVDFFLPKFFQEAHGWSPATFARIAVIGGALGLTGQLFAGWITDRAGRRATAIGFLGLEPLAAIVLYAVIGPVAIPFFVVWMFSSVAADVVGRTYSKELFPTAVRATAAGALLVLDTTGSVAGLAAETWLYELWGAHWSAIQALAATGLLIPFIVGLAYPETAGRELEEVAADARAGPSPRRAEPTAQLASR